MPQNNQEYNNGQAAINNTNSDNQPPYHFVYNDPKLTTQTKRVAHNSKESGLFSGEIKFSLTTLTQSIFGCYQDKNTLTVEGKDKEKTHLYPAFYQDRSMILGSSILGALRHNCAALTNAPMEHIGEQTFAYRPSIGNGPDLKAVPAIVMNKAPFTLRVFRGQPEYIFVSELASKYFVANDKLGDYDLPAHPRLLVKEKYLFYNDKETVISKSLYASNEITNSHRAALENQTGAIRYRFLEYNGANHFNDYQYYLYKGGIEPQGRLFQTRSGTNHINYVGILLNTIGCDDVDIRVNKKLYEQYKNTTDHLKDQNVGHISSRHPNLPAAINSLPDDIQQHRRVNVEQVIFAEVKSSRDPLTIDDINSIGNNYNYYWAYQNSIHNVKGQLRPQIQQSFNPEALPLVQKLFGYTNESGEGQDDKLAGLVSINHALEQITTPGHSVKQKNITIPLKPLGQPKPSAGEFYLRPNGSSVINKVPHYGYSPNENPEYELNGRKFYLHQHPYSPNAQEAAENENNHLATTARFVVPQQTEYRSTLRFKNLNKTELGLLLLALSPNSLQDDLKTKHHTRELGTLLEEVQTLAIKLGYARSLGFGSVQAKIHSITSQCQSDLAPAELINAFLSTQTSFDHIKQWIKIHNFDLSKTYTFPNNGDESYRFHSKVKQNELAIRKGKRQNLPIETKVLRPL